MLEGGFMYISRVEIDRNDRQKIKDLTHLGAYHSWVEDSFDEIGEIRSRKLWRIDTIEGKEYLIIVSQEKPILEKLEKYGVPTTGQIKDYRKFLDALEEGKTYIFRTSLNPCKSISQGRTVTGVRGRVVPCLAVEDQMNYLLDRTEKNGFSIDIENGVKIVERRNDILKKKGEKSIRLVKATYEGLLTITDLDKFKNLLKSGLGKKKAYGFGLFTVVPYAK